jgi:hypothetical protein
MTRLTILQRARVTRTAPLRALRALAATAALAACGTEDAADPLAPNAPTGRVRFVNVITDASRAVVNATLEGQTFGVNLGYLATTPASLPAPASAPYSPVYTGDRTIVLKRTADTTVTVAALAFTSVAGEDRTVYATGGAGGSAVTAFITLDDNQAPAAGQARVRVVHLSPAAGPVDVFVTAPNANLATATPTLAGVAVRSASTYLAVPAGTYQVRVVPAGTAPAARAGAVALNVASLVLAAGAARTIVAADAATGGTPLRSLVLVDR